MCFPSLRIYFDKSVHKGTEGAEELALGEFVEVCFVRLLYIWQVGFADNLLSTEHCDYRELL